MSAVPGLRETLETLRRRAACLGIATGPDEASYEPLHREGLIGCFAAAKTAGMSAVAVLTGAGDSALLSRSGPDRIIASVTLLPDLLEVP